MSVELNNSSPVHSRSGLKPASNNVIVEKTQDSTIRKVARWAFRILALAIAVTGIVLAFHPVILPAVAFYTIGVIGGLILFGISKCFRPAPIPIFKNGEIIEKTLVQNVNTWIPKERNESNESYDYSKRFSQDVERAKYIDIDGYRYAFRESIEEEILPAILGFAGNDPELFTNITHLLHQGSLGDFVGGSIPPKGFKQRPAHDFFRKFPHLLPNNPKTKEQVKIEDLFIGGDAGIWNLYEINGEKFLEGRLKEVNFAEVDSGGHHKCVGSLPITCIVRLNLYQNTKTFIVRGQASRSSM